MERRYFSKTPRHQRPGVFRHRTDGGVSDPGNAPRTGKLPRNTGIESQNGGSPTPNVPLHSQPLGFETTPQYRAKVGEEASAPSTPAGNNDGRSLEPCAGGGAQVAVTPRPASDDRASVGARR